ncbi:MAG: tetratricopeptide repeat protein [Hyphomicrobiaceae bacterium]
MKSMLSGTISILAGVVVLLGLTVLATAQSVPRPTPQELDSLFATLKAAQSEPEARVAELAIWAAWIKSGSDEIDKLTGLALEAMQTQDYQEALATLDVVVAKMPDFAEGWNKRATVLYIVGDLDRSMADIDKVLALEPRHFGAISGIGLIQIAKGNKPAALEAYRKVIEIYPLSPGALQSIESLQKEVEGDPT